MEFEKLNNTRDLGGMTTVTGKRIKPGRLIRSGRLCLANAADEKLLEQTVSAVVDFRGGREARDGGRVRAGSWRSASSWCGRFLRSGYRVLSMTSPFLYPECAALRPRGDRASGFIRYLMIEKQYTRIYKFCQEVFTK